MIRREKIHALILSRQKEGEADRRLTLFTKDYGILQVLAKGVRKIPSRRGGSIEPLTHVIAIVSGHARSYFLAAVEVVNEYPALRAQPEALVHAQSLAYLTPRLFQEEEPQASLFDAVHHAWDILPELSPSKRAILEVAVVLHALQCAGWAPSFRHCLVCRTRQPHDAAVLDSQQGGWRCLSCHTSFAGTRVSLSPRLLRAVRFIAQTPTRALQLQMTEEESNQLLEALRIYVHDTVGSPLPSLTSFSLLRTMRPGAQYS